MASSKREKELARQRAERQAARRAAAAQRAKQRNLVIASVAAVAVVAIAAIGLGVATRGGSTDAVTTAADPSAAPSAAASTEPAASTKPSAAASAGASPAANAAGTCTYERTSEPAAKKVELPPTTGVETTQEFTVTVATNRGDIVFDMPSAKAPCTANSLRSLAHFAYFDKTPCHRLTTQGISVLQCGDPSGTGGGGPGYQFADENLKGATYPRGTVAMANAGPGTNGSQFFLVYADSTLPPNYTPFGTITKGLDILDTVAKAGSDDSNGAGDGKPKLPVEITTLRVAAKAG